MSTAPPLGDPAPAQLAAARLALHYAAQPFAAASYALHPPREDHTQSNLLWSAERGGFVGRPLASGARLAVDPAGLRTGLVTADGEDRLFDLAGLTLEEANQRLADLLDDAGASQALSLEALPYELPDAPYADGGVFPQPDAATAELVRWFAGADALLRGISTELLGGAEVRGWPHHFDLAALLVLDPDADAEEARSVNVGFSPGDGSYDEPYLYVSPWPYPAADALPELPRGARWHTEGFTAAVVTGTALLETGGDVFAEGAELVRAATKACLELLPS